MHRARLPRSPRQALENAARRSIEEIDHILGLPLDREHPQYAAELRAEDLSHQHDLGHAGEG